MKIRTKLVVVFLLVAVVPLTAIVLYSYVSSLGAVRAAVEEDAATLASRMDQELGTIRSELGTRITRVGSLPIEGLGEGAAQNDSEQTDADLEAKILQEMGPSATFVDSLEFVPAIPDFPEPPAPAKPATLAPVAVASPLAPVAEVPEAPKPPSIPEIPVPDAGATVVDPNENAAGSSAENRELTAEEQQRVKESAMKIAAQSMKLVQPVIVKVLSGETPTPEDTSAQTAAAQRIAAEAATIESAGRTIAIRRAMTEKEKKLLEAEREKARLVLGREFDAPVVKEGHVIGHVRAQVSADEILARILSIAGREKGEIPFALDSENELHTASEDDRGKLESLPLDAVRSAKEGRFVIGHWIVATSFDGESGLKLGIARPIRDSVETMRRTAARNYGVGLMMIFVALFAITPISRHLTKEISLVTEGAQRIAQGDLDVEVPVRSRDEVGQLAVAFNRMARDLSDQQKRLVEEERLRHERDVRESLLTAEMERKTRELEDAREFQLSLLPKTLPEHSAFEVAVHMTTATEVGGDYYDFRMSRDGSLVVAIGDATGHGARAGTMVTVVKSLFSAWTGEEAVAAFLAEATRTIKRMELGRMAMALSIVRFGRDGMVVSAAGMPPVLVWRAATSEVEEIAVEGMPLGTLAFDYDERSVPLAAGDTVLLMTDGFPELLNAIGEPFGYPKVQEAFRDAAAGDPRDLISKLAAVADAWSDEPSDDITFVVVRCRGAA